MMNKPSYVTNKPEHIQKQWEDIYNRYSVESPAVGLGVANKWLSNQREELVVRDLSFKVDNEQIIQRSIGGVEYVDFLLADTIHDNYGTKYSESFLQRLADYINEHPEDIAEGDFNHDTLNQLQAQGYSKEGIKSKLKSLKQGVAKAVKAIYEKGKLYLRTVVDPRYKDKVLRSKGVSIEGSFVRSGDTFVDGKILGFSFIDSDKKDLGNPRAKILK